MIRKKTPSFWVHVNENIITEKKIEAQHEVDNHNIIFFKIKTMRPTDTYMLQRIASPVLQLKVGPKGRAIISTDVELQWIWLLCMWINVKRFITFIWQNAQR